VLHQVAGTHPDVRLLVHEHEPDEAYALLAGDDVDLALTYDYELAPAAFDRTVEVTPLWSAPWGLGVPEAAAASFADATTGGGAAGVFAHFADQDWIVNSRNTADGDVVRTLASLAGFEARIAHRVDSLELVQDLVVAGLGVGLIPADQPTRPGVAVLALRDPEVRLRAYAVVRRGRSVWPPLALVLDRLRGGVALTGGATLTR
jgi:DNA-binding transcriptional LysR family regulator